MNDLHTWTTRTLFEALLRDETLGSGDFSIELIDGAEPTIQVIMREFGDLPLFVTVAGDQIIVEAVLWSEDQVIDTKAFNHTVLRTHKYFPLSTISLDRLNDGKNYYQMFGSLSAASILPNIIFEIQILASNVIQATEAYAEHLKSQKHAIGEL